VISPCGHPARRSENELVVQTHDLHFAAMDRRLARRNLRTGLITAVIGLLMFALTFVAAVMYVQ
jgi:predicted secreted protein